MASESTSRGLEGIVAAETRLSRVDGDAGELVIGGFPLEELAPNATYEECVFLLLRDRLPTAAELERFREKLATRRTIPDATRSLLCDAAEAGVGIGIPRELFTTVFASARVGGWTAHCLEQLGDNRLIRPRSAYVGETGRTWTQIDERTESGTDR